MSMTTKFRGVTFAYPGQKPVFRDLVLDLPADKTVLLNGENGTGKTTLASLAAGLLHPQEGRIHYEYQGLPYPHKGEIYKHISLLKQDAEHNLLGVNPLDDLLLWLLSSDDKVYESDLRIVRSLSDWNLSDKKHTPLWELSSGELKCLALAGISLHKSRFWILDEPLSSLDERHVQLLLKIIQAKRKASPGMLIISHRSDLFEELSDKVITLTEKGIMESER
ncbi:MAG: ABC transporter ATP-binding protein [Candidatus Cloacimonadaceae bacterium]